VELFYVLFILLPGLLIYRKMRKEEGTDEGNASEHVVLIRGFYASIPMIIAGILFARWAMPGIPVRDSVYRLFTNPLYLLIYFAVIPVYAQAACSISMQWIHRIQPRISKKISAVRGKNYYRVEYNDIATEIIAQAHKHKRVIGRVTKDGKEICLGSVCFLSSSRRKQIGFEYQKEYRAYFEDGIANDILNPVGTYLDMESDYMIDLYNGDRLPE